MPPVFFSTPALFYQVLWASHAVLVLGELGLLRLIACPYILVEAERNVKKKTPVALPRYQDVMTNINWEIVPNPSKAEVLMWSQFILDKDAPVLAAAVNAKPRHFATLDAKDFLKSSQVTQNSGLNIITPGTLLRLIRDVLAKGL